MIVWISSIKRMISFSCFDASSITCLIRHSNSHRYLVPATIIDISIETTRLFCIANGTLPNAIRRARPSTTAVFPTPGSPTRQGLFLVFLLRILISRSISISRPIIGSIFPFRALAVRSVPKKSSAGVFESLFSWGLLLVNGLCAVFEPLLFVFACHMLSSSIFTISSIGPNIPFSFGHFS